MDRASRLKPDQGSPQAARESEDHFAALGVERRFGLDPSALEKRFYALSREHHPDRGGALERMSALNSAYTVLKNRDERRAHLVELEGLSLSGGKIPFELAEAWFDVQDSMEPAAVASFKAELDGYVARQEQRLAELEKQYDAAPSKAVLEKIAEELRSRAYLKSLERDVRGR